jgi:8-oxo-dGTP diphosphatase
MGGKAAFTRNSAKAIIIENGKLLVIRLKDEKGDWYLLPGGGQEPTETLEEALIRECLEEVNVHVVVGPLRFIREYFSCNHEFKAVDHDAHQIEFMFVCAMTEGDVPGIGSAPDNRQEGVDWLDLAALGHSRLYPLSMRRFFMDIGNGGIPVYHGDVN